MLRFTTFKSTQLFILFTILKVLQIWQDGHFFFFLLHSVLCRMVMGLENPLFVGVGSFVPGHVFLDVMWKLAVVRLGIGFSPGGLPCELVELLPVWWLSSMSERFENYTSYCPVSEAA